jgi:3-hydroxymyristoyl/3-hydroxydecanoyl-(acyl carrier protein) dehydratase
MMPLPALRPRPGGFALVVEPGHPAFRGHFPGDPVLPGVVQVDWAIRLGETLFGPQGTFLGLERVKFLEPVRPGEALELALVAPRPGRLDFRYSAGGVLKSSGSARFEAAP